MKAWRRRGFSLLCCTAAAIGLRLISPRERLLLDRATKIADTGSWRGASYVWLSDHELMFLRKGIAAAAVRRDVTTGRETALTELSAAMRREWQTNRIAPEAWGFVSPDGH